MSNRWNGSYWRTWKYKFNRPFVGQCFSSEEETFIFYKNDANRYGFTIRKGRTEEKKLVRCDFFCHRQGKQPLKIMDPSKEQWNRKSLKCGCKAHLSIILRKSFDIFPREWHVTKFVVDHNYYFFSPLEVRFLLANRVITIDDEKHILFLKEVGFSIREVMCVMELKKHLKHGQLPFFQRDIRNLYVKWGGRMQRMMSWIS